MFKNFLIAMIVLFVLAIFVGLVGLVFVAVCCVGGGLAIVGGLVAYFLHEMEVID